VGELYLESRLDFLRNTQNEDGGWGYFPGKQSWLEPTTYAMLALHRTPGSEARLDRSWKLVRSWQTADGSSRPAGPVEGGTWVTAHAVTLASVRGVYDDQVRRSVDWMLSVVGAEHNLLMRTASFLHLLKSKLDVSHEGWPWREGNAAWIEPTVHTLVALKKVAGQYRSAELNRRVLDGEELVLEPFNRLIEAGHLMAYKYEGFWRAMDTLRDRQVLEEMVERGETPWRVPPHVPGRVAS